jgi:hypothetical protein
MSIFSFFKKKQPEFQYNPLEVTADASENILISQPHNDLEFVDSSNAIYATVPIQLAKDVPIVTRNIVESQGKKFTFPLCPGMWDYSRMGYIMSAWTDFKIKANKAGVAFVVGGANRSSIFPPPFKMGTDISDGLFKFEGVVENVYNFQSPWRIFANTKNISCLLLPAYFHTDPEILENLYIYPGVVDYDRFRVVNMIASVKKKSTIHIKAGEPLLHIIPLFNDKIVCGYGPPTPEQEAELRYDPTMHTNHFYRKKMQPRKKDSDFALQNPQENKEEQSE